MMRQFTLHMEHRKKAERMSHVSNGSTEKKCMYLLQLVASTPTVFCFLLTEFFPVELSCTHTMHSCAYIFSSWHCMY